MSTLPDCMAELIVAHGGVRPLARAAGLDPGYVHRLHTGEKGEPSTETLAALGITRTVSYALATPPSPASPTLPPMETPSHD